MQANVHTPERLTGESFSAYQARRLASKHAVGMVYVLHTNTRLSPQWTNPDRADRRREIASAGGIRQAKRNRYIGNEFARTFGQPVEVELA